MSPGEFLRPSGILYFSTIVYSYPSTTHIFYCISVSPAILLHIHCVFHSCFIYISDILQVDIAYLLIFVLMFVLSIVCAGKYFYVHKQSTIVHNQKY